MSLRPTCSTRSSILSSSVLGILLSTLSLGLAPTSHAQGIIDQQKCPHVDGNDGGDTDPFIYASWVDDDPKSKGRNFRRCIENKANKQIWTWWKGLLGEGWIPVGHRRYGTTFITAGEVTPGKSELYWGDNKKRLDPEAKCERTENACKRGRAAAFDISQDIARTVKEKDVFRVTAYQEFYVPTDASKPTENLGKFAIIVTSRLLEGKLTYQLSLVVSRAISDWNPVSGDYVFRLESQDATVAKALALEQVRPTLKFVRDIAVSSAGLAQLDVNIAAVRPRKLLATSASIAVLGPSAKVVASFPVLILVGQ